MSHYQNPITGQSLDLKRAPHAVEFNSMMQSHGCPVRVVPGESHHLAAMLAAFDWLATRQVLQQMGGAA